MKAIGLPVMIFMVLLTTKVNGQFTPNIIVEPVDDFVCSKSGTAIFSVVATGTDLSYQWYAYIPSHPPAQPLDPTGPTHSGGRSATLTLTSITGSPPSGLEFYCKVWNIYGNDYSNHVTYFYVDGKPIITSHPSSSDVCEGGVNGSIELKVIATGSYKSYQWYRNGSAISGATSNKYYTYQAGTYYCRVSNACGYVNSNSATITTIPAPSIDEQSDYEWACAGNEIFMYVNATSSGGPGALTFDWKKIGISSSLGNDFFYSIPSAELDDAGQYYCLVSHTLNNCFVKSENIVVDVYTPPTDPNGINANPNDAQCPGTDITLSVNGGNPGVGGGWWWYKGSISGSNCIGSGSSKIVHPTTQTRYYVRAESECGNSIEVWRDIIPKSTSVEPTSIDAIPATVCSGSNVSFTVNEGNLGTGATWRLGTGCHTGEIKQSSTSSISYAPPAGTHTYYIWASGDCNTTSCKSATVTVNTPATIDEQPEGDVICLGEDYTLSISSSGSSPITYQWHKDGSPVTDWTASNQLQLLSVIPENAGTYRCYVKNSCTSENGIQSDPATLTIKSPPVITQEPNDMPICESGGTIISFATLAEGSDLVYKWELSEDNGNVWNEVQNNEIYTGASTSELTLTNPDVSMDQFLFRCIISGYCSPADTTREARLEIGTEPEILTHPLFVEICKGKDASFSVSAGGSNPLAYKWLKNDVTYTDWSFDSTLTILSAGSLDAGQYKCVVKNPCNAVGITSEPATLTVMPGPSLDLGDDIHLCPGDTATINAGFGHESYAWSTDENTRTIDVFEGGIYSVTVKDNMGCENTDNVMVIMDPELPGIDLGPDAAYCAGTDVVLDAGKLFDVYLWNNDNVTHSVEVTKTGTFWVEASRNNTVCIERDTVTIEIVEPYQDEEICLITVDMATGNNIIVWEKTPDVNIVAYRIYRQTTVAGKYELLETIPFDNLSIYMDDEADPEVRQWVYKITVVDTCNNESYKEASPYHRPLFLEYNGADDGVNLRWEPYVVEGTEMEFLTYEIYRGSDSTALSYLDEISGDLRVYKDKDPNALTYKYFYRVAGVKSDPCYPAGNTKADAGPYSHSMSNIEDNRLQVVERINNLKSAGSILIYPNPFNESTTLKFPNPGHFEYRLVVRDLSGKVVYLKEDITGEQVILERGNLAAGAYVVEIRGSRIYRSMMVIE